MARGIGIDGCRSGWVAVIIDDSLSNVKLVSKPSFTALWNLLNPKYNRDYILIDVPIGLPEGPKGINNQYSYRDCDNQCRKMLIGNRKRSVFNTPSRQSTKQITASYRQISMLNYGILNKKLTIQSFSIIPKIREVDDFIYRYLNNKKNKIHIQSLMEESHPELCFQKFLQLSSNNFNVGLQHRKKHYKGILERINILNIAGLSMHDIYLLLSHYKKNFIGKDDILDAAILAITAFNIIISAGYHKRKVTQSKQYDYSNKIEMNMVYYE